MASGSELSSEHYTTSESKGATLENFHGSETVNAIIWLQSLFPGA